MTRPPPSPTATHLAESERTLVRAFRQWLSGHVRERACHWQLAWQGLSDLLGNEDGTRAVCALESLVRVICRHARRPILYHEPACPRLGDDEHAVLDLIAACQRNAWRQAAARAERLIDPEGAGELIAAAARLAALLAARDQHLRLAAERVARPAEPAPREEMPRYLN
jgi:hypothetical protein